MLLSCVLLCDEKKKSNSINITDHHQSFILCRVKHCSVYFMVNWAVKHFKSLIFFYSRFHCDLIFLALNVLMTSQKKECDSSDDNNKTTLLKLCEKIHIQSAPTCYSDLEVSKLCILCCTIWVNFKLTSSFFLLSFFFFFNCNALKVHRNYFIKASRADLSSCKFRWFIFLSYSLI